MVPQTGPVKVPVRTTLGATHEGLCGADGQPIQYPQPVFVRNTFIDVNTGRSESLDEFFQPRTVASCPSSAINPKLGSEVIPEEVVTDPLKVLHAVSRDALGDVDSECSTADEEVVIRMPQKAPVISLEAALTMPKLGSPEYPTVGSAGHHLRQCKPCAFVTVKGCDNGVDCKFCHLCDSGEKKRRQKEKKEYFSAMRQLQQLQQMAAKSWPFGSSVQA